MGSEWEVESTVAHPQVRMQVRFLWVCERGSCFLLIYLKIVLFSALLVSISFPKYMLVPPQLIHGKRHHHPQTTPSVHLYSSIHPVFGPDLLYIPAPSLFPECHVNVSC
jgi:hypothetical protein